MWKRSLRSRIIFSLVFIVTICSLLFAIGLVVIKQKLEEATFGNMARDQLAEVLSYTDSGKEIPAYQFIGGWKFYSSLTPEDLPQGFIDLEPGSYHSLVVNERYFQVEVADWKHQKVWLAFDITDWEEQEHEILEFLLYGALIVLAVAIALGIQASYNILAPIRALTKKVESVKPDQRAVRISSEFQGSEIGKIAAAFDSYMERLDQFVVREQSFTNAASHELRTPLSIIMGAADIIETQNLSETGKRALSRVNRASQEMLAFIEATLFIAREGSQLINQEAPVNLEALLQGLIAENQPLWQSQKNTLQLDTIENAYVSCPSSLLKICIGNILRNAIEHTSSGEISIMLNANQLIVHDSGEGIPEKYLQEVYTYNFSTKPGGSGMGLYLVKRICEKMNWNIEISSQLKKGTVVRLTFEGPSEN